MNFLSRRDFLKILTQATLALSGLLGIGGLLRFLGYADETEQPQDIDLGSIGDYPLGSRTLVANRQFLLVHQQSGFRAINTTCTHLGCRLTSGPDGFACPCHGSHFDLDGSVISGPAVKTLDTQVLEPAENGHLIIQISG
ncbi:MAG: ubiquinol-cytochrome c reductase iron-sulfur subunit [Anaerolineales bacterium]|jgi:cytochrome b6-f complex iron-sulfur subunit